MRVKKTYGYATTCILGLIALEIYIEIAKTFTHYPSGKHFQEILVKAITTKALKTMVNVLWSSPDCPNSFYVMIIQKLYYYTF